MYQGQCALIWKLYQGQSAYVRLGESLSDPRAISRGVNQGYSVSPLLYITYDEAMVREATVDTQVRVSVGGHVINAIRYADDKAVVSTGITEVSEQHQ